IQDCGLVAFHDLTSSPWWAGCGGPARTLSSTTPPNATDPRRLRVGSVNFGPPASLPRGRLIRGDPRRIRGDLGPHVAGVGVEARLARQVREARERDGQQRRLVVGLEPLHAARDRRADRLHRVAVRELRGLVIESGLVLGEEGLSESRAPGVTDAI